jgi:hypothetical protein
MAAGKRKKPRSLKSARAKGSGTRGSGAKVWERPPPRSASHTHLRPAAKAKAKARAKREGRRYPNLVDNIRAARGK